MCCTPLPSNQVMQAGQVASCTIRDDSVRGEAQCIQSPDEWDESVGLIERIGLASRLQQLKTISKIKKRIIVNSNRLRNNGSILPVKQSNGGRPLPGELEYPGRRPIFNQPINDPTAAALQTWQPSDDLPSYSKVSYLSLQESLPIIKKKFQASLNASLTRDATTVAPDVDAEFANTDIDTAALMEELLSLSNEDNTPVVISPFGPSDSLTTPEPESNTEVSGQTSDSLNTVSPFDVSSFPFVISFLDDGVTNFDEGGKQPPNFHFILFFFIFVMYQ